VSGIDSSESIEPGDVGVRRGEPLPFEFRPSAWPSPLIVSFPHVGLDWPTSLGPRPQVNFPRNADYAVDRLYVRAEMHGAATLRARYSRLVVDLNRAADDVDPELVPDHPAPRPRTSLSAAKRGDHDSRKPIRNRGVVWASAVGNIPLLTTLTHAQLRHRLDQFYWPYHRALELLIERRRRRFGYAIVLDAHSMPGTVAGDLVLGTCSGRACAPELIDLATRILSGHGVATRQQFGSRWPLELAIDDPYRGGQIISTFGQPDAYVHALQLEVSRALYMDERRLDPLPLPLPQDLAGAGGSLARPRPAQSGAGRRRGEAPILQRDRRRLNALVSAIDALVLELARERESLADRTAAE
jgi:N-formylglutamate amidohydrolase